jgi:hypothetical protein
MRIRATAATNGEEMVKTRLRAKQCFLAAGVAV